MCGIIGYTGNNLPALSVLFEGMRALEYRGYDSAGISVQSRGRIRTWKAAGKLTALNSLLPKRGNKSTVGIGHTRWATHGEPSDTNAHPHTDSNNEISVVHNGIIENSTQLREQLIAAGTEFKSETDTEIIAHLIASETGASLTTKVRNALTRIKGTYGLAVIDIKEPGTIVGACNGSPLIIGLAEGAMLLASDSAALVRHTRQQSHLEDGEIVTLTATTVQVNSLDAVPREIESTTIELTQEDYESRGDLGEHPHFMYREIIDQPTVTSRTIGGRLDHRFNTAHLGGLNLNARELLDTTRIKILGCGSAYYAGKSGSAMIESLARIAADAEPAAEFRYRNPVIDQNTLYIVVSQSGETYDTLAALREIKRKGGRVLGIVNMVGSTIAREVDGGIYMHAGPEISVASTKTYTSSLVCFALLALHLARLRDMSIQAGQSIVQALESLPELIEKTLASETAIANAAQLFHNSSSMFFVGRAAGYPVALEGAQKLKEVSYIHAEGYPSSELKHGPLALITNKTPTLAILPDDELLEKSIASLEEIKARRGPIIALTSSSDNRVKKLATVVFTIPKCHAVLEPVLMGVSLQLFAYHCALALGRDIDQPRNLAKSVTVE